MTCLLFALSNNSEVLHFSMPVIAWSLLGARTAARSVFPDQCATQKGYFAGCILGRTVFSTLLDMSDTSCRPIVQDEDIDDGSEPTQSHL